MGSKEGHGLATKPPPPPKDIRCFAGMCSRSVPERFMIHLGRQHQPCLCSIAQLCPTLGNAMDCGPSDSSVRGIFQARILEWVARLPLVTPKYLSTDWLVHKPPVHRRSPKSSRQTSETVKCKSNLNLYVSLKLSTPGALPWWSSG